MVDDDDIVSLPLAKVVMTKKLRGMFKQTPDPVAARVGKRFVRRADASFRGRRRRLQGWSRRRRECHADGPRDGRGPAAGATWMVRGPEPGGSTSRDTNPSAPAADPRWNHGVDRSRRRRGRRRGSSEGPNGFASRLARRADQSTVE